MLGQQLQINARGEQLTKVRMTEIEADGVTLDANHPLAGQILKFESTDWLPGKRSAMAF
jgi:FKBP-type peptidyl-prolyl cis-trans isomerase 2